MQIVAVPLFDRNMEEKAYIFRELKENLLISTSHAFNMFDGNTYSETLSVLKRLGLETFTLGKPVFVPIREINLLGDLPAQCGEDPGKIVFVLEKPLSNTETYLPVMRKLRDAGYRFGVSYPVPLHATGDAVLLAASYALLPQGEEEKDASRQALRHLRRFYFNITPVAVNIRSKETLQALYGDGYGLYESKVFNPTVQGGAVGPLKVNAIRLLNTVQDENFDFEEVAGIVRGDPALTVSLLKLVNTSSHMRGRISSIQQAVAMMGQREVRKWVTTAVSRSLGSDRPGEITRISLIRAKFSENLAPAFEMAHMTGELFLTGLFSVLDSILDMPMAEALNQVTVTDNVRAALLNGAGIYAPVIKFVRDYENAQWEEVSRQMIVLGLDEELLSEAYLSALVWYRDLVSEPEEPPAGAAT